MKRVVITGMATITPAGVGQEALWKQLTSGRACTQQIDRFDASRYQCRVAGQANDFDANKFISPRLAKRTDRFTHLALAAVGEALQNANLTIGDTSGIPSDRVAVMVGNVLGGWEFAERELRNLWVEGIRGVSPYQATAWFPAAPQGNICIAYGIKGRARTFVSDRASGAYALIHGAETIRRGQADVVIAGGTEAPLSPYGWLCCETSGYLTRSYNDRPEGAYRPFERGHTGIVLGEGSSFLILEDREHAERRNAHIYGELSGWAIGTDGYLPYYTVEPQGRILSRTITKSLKHAELAPTDIDVVFADGSAVPVEDATEVYALKSAFGDHSYRMPVTSPKSALGHMLGAATATDVVIALEALARREIPPTANLDRPAYGFDLDFVRGTPRQLESCNHSLVISRGLGGINTCLVVSG